MRKRNIGKRIVVMLMALMMMLPMTSLETMAAVGDISTVSTGLTGDIDTADTISLPIKVLDYENDGMLFEYAEAYAGKTGVAAAKTASDFGATWYEDYTTKTSVGGSINTGNYWSDVSLALKTGTYANYTRATWAGNTTANWTGNRAGAVLADFSESSTYTTDQVRYMVVVFRSNVRSGNFTVGLNRENLNGAGSNGNYTGNIAVTTENNTNWTYAVLDLQTGTLGSNWSKGAVYGVYVGLPLDATGEWMDLAHVAFFGNKDQATAFGEYALTDGSDRGDNRGFGLLRSSRNQSGGVNYESIIDATSTVEQLNTYGDTTSVDFSSLTTLGYTLLGTFKEKGIANVGLLESSLSAKGYPVYKQEVVTYVANLLQHSLEIPERNSDGWKNYRYVKGTASSVYGGTDLATALRTKTNKNMGSYAEAAGKDLVGTWTDVNKKIASYYDAAYFILNSIFVPGSYNEKQSQYDYLVLSAGTDSETKDKVYVFDGGFVNTASPSATTAAAIEYDEENHTMQNTSAASKAHFVYEGTSTTTLNPFLPVRDDNTEAGMTKSSYYQDDGVINGVKKVATKDTLYSRDFNFAMTSEGEFVYHADDELFFEFEGDDDVYLFINDELVMDIGSAHSIDIVRFELNDYVNAAKAGTLGSDARNKALALEEGNTYSFKFYYMERHSYGSNIRICTNIRVTDPSMVTAKNAWQTGNQLDFGSIVDKDQVVEYGFAITNNGEENLYNLTFTDNDIGVKLDPTSGLTVTGKRVYDTKGETLEASDLTAVVSHPDYSDINITFADNNELKVFLKELTAGGTEEGEGLFTNATVQIRGIGYKLSTAQVEAGVFDNTVLTTSTNKTKSKTLQGQATMRVFVPADPMYYEWAGHELSVTKAKLVTDVLAAANQTDNILNGKVSNLTANNVNKIELTTKAGTEITSPYVTIDGNYSLKINYDTPGSKVFYAKITYNSSKNSVIVPVLVNVTDVEDSVYVLDYGLKVNLTDNDELIKNDTLTVPGRSTLTGILATGKNGAYSSNEITFTAQNEVKGSAGTFGYNNGTVTYTPSDFMEGVDTVQVAMNVYEDDIKPSNITGTLDINNEVEMYKNVMALPANVVYYEDDFPAITYNMNGDGDAVANTFSKVGNGSSSKSQSNDQTTNYGNDAAYSNEANDEYSGDSLTKITIADNDMTASFKFNGTGFELIGRTNAYDSATLTVKVFDNEGNRIKTIPVITEFDNNADGGQEEIYQVPVIKVKDLIYGTYTVEISGVPARDFDTMVNGAPAIIPSYLYIDGLRIYQPLGAVNDNYLEEENGAQFIEIRDQIISGKAAVVEWDSELKVSSGLLTWTENYDGSKDNYEGSDVAVGSEYYEFVANEVDSVDEYLLEGPNNEVYMMGDYLDSALLLYVKETDAKTHNLQIGVHAVDEGLFVGADSTGMNTTLKYGVDGSWVTLDTVESATEQYYTIDYTKCPKVDGRYQVVVLVDNGMVSFTNLKMNGLELDAMSETSATALRFENGFIMGTDAEGQETEVSPADVPAFLSLRSMMMTLNDEDGVTEDTTPEDGEDVTTPDEGEDTTTPDEDGDDTTADDDKKPAKADKNKKDEKPSKPGNNGNNGNNKKPDKKNNNGNSTKSEKSNKDDNDTVVEEEETVTSDEEVSVSVPDKDEVVEVPEENVSESMSIWDMIWEFISGLFKFFGGVFVR